MYICMYVRMYYACMYVCVWITALFMYIMLYSEVIVFRDEFCFSFLGQTRNGFSEPSPGRKYEGSCWKTACMLDLFK